MIEIKFPGTSTGVETDKKVQAAVAKFQAKASKYNGELAIEAKYKATHDAYCKISGTGLKSPVVTTDKTVGGAVNKGLGKVFDILSNNKQTVKDKKEHANKKANKANEAKEVQDEEFGL